MFKPMLAPPNNPMKYLKYFEELRFPLMCSPKLDGIRCLTVEEQRVDFDSDLNEIPGPFVRVCKSREFIDLPSREVQREFSDYTGLDGELMQGDPTDHDVYNRTQSYVMSFDKIGDINYYVFDITDDDLADCPFEMRYDLMVDRVESFKNPKIHAIEHTLCNNLEQLLEYESEQLAEGYEGIMMRSPDGCYKHGRATWREATFYKLKRFADFEAKVVGFEEELKNTNILEVDALGYAKRSTAKAGMFPAGTLGKFIVEWEGELLKVGRGSFTRVEMQFIWDNKTAFAGKWLKCRHFPHGMKDKPRLPRAVGFRDPMDFDKSKG